MVLLNINILKSRSFNTDKLKVQHAMVVEIALLLCLNDAVRCCEHNLIKRDVRAALSASTYHTIVFIIDLKMPECSVVNIL